MPKEYTKYIIVCVLLILQSCNSNKSSLKLSEEEENWLENHQNFTFAVDDTYPPLNYRATDGELTGLNIELVELIENRLEVNFTLVGSTWDTAIIRAMNHEVDGIINATPLKKRKEKLAFTQQFFRDPLALIVHKSADEITSINHLNNKTIAVKKGSRHLLYLKNKTPDSKIYEINTLQEGILLLSQQEVDGVFDDLAPLHHLITTMNFNNIEVAFIVVNEKGASIGVRKDAPVLLSVLNKAINSISEEEKLAIQNKWLKFAPEYDFTKYYIAIGALLAILLLIGFWNRSLQNAVRKRTNELKMELKNRERAQQELMEAKEKAEEREQFANSITEQTPDIIYAYNTVEKRNTYINKNIREFLGFKKGDAPEDSTELLKALIHPDDLQKFITGGLLKDWPSQYVNHYEYRIKDANNNWRWFSGREKELSRKNGKIENIIGIVTDITRQKSDKLKLIEAKERAEESDKLKSAFLANISHEIRTPMNGILGFAELLKLPDLDTEEKISYLTIIEESGQRMLDIITDIINISLIETGKIEVDYEEVDLTKTLHELQSLYESLAESRGVKLKLDIPEPVNNHILQTDKNKLNQIISQLLKNAIKFTKNGEVHVGFKPNIHKYEIIVKDTGQGISPELKEKIFDTFRQGDLRVANPTEGFGIGLAISKAYTEALNGTISFDSEMGKGTTFRVTLPNKKQQI